MSSHGNEGWKRRRPPRITDAPSVTCTRILSRGFSKEHQWIFLRKRRGPLILYRRKLEPRESSDFSAESLSNQQRPRPQSCPGTRMVGKGFGEASQASAMK